VEECHCEALEEGPNLEKELQEIRIKLKGRILISERKDSDPNQDQSDADPQHWSKCYPVMYIPYSEKGVVYI
jgi:hypothetical protein